MGNRQRAFTESTRLPHQTLIPRKVDEFKAEEEDEDEVKELEEEIDEMAQKLSNYRSTFPDLFRSGLASALGAERPEFPFFYWDSDQTLALDMDEDQGPHGESCEGMVSAVEDQETIDGISLIKEKISSNACAMPLVLKRMNECISMSNNLNSHSNILYPALKRERTT